MTRSSSAGADRRLVAAVSRWFAAHARPLPWRTTPRRPYASLVSEVMLQQTQVARVIERYGAFMERFPTVESLAAAPEEDVLALWSGLGYYRRARNLHLAARQVVSEHAGELPRDAASLRALRGVGRYTAGAIASIVYDRPEPIVDGNVARVLLRLHGRPLAHGSGAAMAFAWERAGELVGIAGAGGRNILPALFNEGLMELGATICTPARPDCPRCPLRSACIAKAEGMQDRIPSPKAEVPRRVLHCAAAVLRDARGRVLLEQRGDAGMWSGLWQAPTMEGTRVARAGELSEWLGVSRLERAGRFKHQISHREVRFVVYRGKIRATARACKGRKLAPLDTLGGLGLGNAQRRAIELGLGT